MTEIRYPAWRDFEYRLSKGNKARLIGRANGTCGENLTWAVDEDALIISGTGEMENFSDNPAPWYEHHGIIEKVIIADGVTTIGDWAFKGHRGLTDVTIGNSVKTIGDWAFFGCESLTEIKIPNSVKRIGDEAFGYCGNLTSLTIGKSVAYIGDEAFSGCGNLTEIHYPKGRGFEENLSKGNKAKLIAY